MATSGPRRRASRGMPETGQASGQISLLPRSPPLVCICDCKHVLIVHPDIGNAKIAGLKDDLQLSSSQYENNQTYSSGPRRRASRGMPETGQASGQISLLPRSPHCDCRPTFMTMKTLVALYPISRTTACITPTRSLRIG
jgi:hypothetical protein